MKSRFVVIIATLVLPLASVSAQAAGGMSNMSGMSDMSGATASTTAQGHGKVDRVDTSKGTVTLTHGAIPAIGWPAMTMEFPFKDRSMAKSVKPGQRVDFELAPLGGGKYQVVKIVPTQG